MRSVLTDGHESHEARVSAVEEAADVLLQERKMRAELLMQPLKESSRQLVLLAAADVQEVLMLRSPPKEVHDCMVAVCIIFSIEPEMVTDRRRPTAPPTKDWWSPSLKLLGNPAFLQLVRYFNKSALPPDVAERIRSEIGAQPPTAHEVAEADAAGRCVEVVSYSMQLQQGEDDSIGFALISALATWVNAFVWYDEKVRPPLFAAFTACLLPTPYLELP